MRLGLHISSTGYPEDRTFCFTKVTEHNNTSFNYKVVEDEDGKKDGKEAITDSKEETSKKRAQRKAKRDAMQAQALLLAAVSRSSIFAFAYILMP